MEDRLKAALTVYAKAQSRVLDRVFDNIKRTGNPSSADLAFCLPDDVIAGLPQEERYAAFLRKFRFLGYAIWKSTCYHQVRLPDDVIAGLPQKERYAAFPRKFRFLGYAIWKSSCYHQVREHTTFAAERTLLIESFPALERRFREGVREGHSAAEPTVGPDTPPDIISSTVTGNGCTLFQLQVPLGIDASIPSGESRRRHP